MESIDSTSIENRKPSRPSVWNTVLYAVGIIVLMAASVGAGMLWTQNQNLQKELASATKATPTPEYTRSLAAGLIPTIQPTDWVRGNKDANVILVEYSDLECPFCKRFHTTADQLVAEYGDRVAFVYRHLPLPIHASAEEQAEASECVGSLAGSQAFYGFIDRIFDRTKSTGTSFTRAELAAIANELGVQTAALAKCMDSNEVMGVLDEHMAQAVAASLTSTPSIVLLRVDNPAAATLIRGAQPLETFRQSINTFLQ